MRIKTTLLAGSGYIVALPLFILVAVLLARPASGAARDRMALRAVGGELIALASDGIPHTSVKAHAAMATSGGRVLLTCALSALAGLLLGVCLGLAPTIRHLSLPSIEWLRGLPITFLLAAAVPTLGALPTDVPWMLASIPCTCIVTLSVIKGVSELPSTRICATRSLFGTRAYGGLFYHFYVKSILPSFLLGVRLTVPYAVILIAVLEYVGAGSHDPGFGSLVMEIESNGGTEATLIACIIGYGLAGLALISCVMLVEKRLLRWRA